MFDQGPFVLHLGMEKMSINELSHETKEELCDTLEKPTLDWKMLMRKAFPSHYSEHDIGVIGREGGRRPAKVLLEDLTLREITLEELVNGLRKIGNKRAVSIIQKGRCISFMIDTYH